MPGFTRFSSPYVPVAASQRRSAGLSIAYLVQGAGGGGSYGVSGSHFGAGGAGGIARAGTFTALTGVAYTVKIGAGGAAQANGSASFFTLSANVVATGGQGPLDSQKNGGQNDDYLGGVYVSSSAAGGGAGAGGRGGTEGGGATVGHGGPGYTWTAGDGVVRGGGGGAGQNSPGGSGGGTNGSAGGVSTPAAANTGAGGGGNNATYYAPGQGGSGVVIVRYPSTESNLSSIGGGLTFSWSSAGGVKTYTFTAGTGNINW